jgi:6-phospho-beta-glucosidase
MKLVVVGAGSSYTPELLRGVLEFHAELPIAEVVLQDPRPDRAGPVTAFCQRMAAASPAPLRVFAEPDLDKALVGADFVVVQIRVGGQEGRHEDIQLGLRHGLIGQETTGVGGFAKALRTVPVVLDIARRIEAIAPDAWMLNFTNPAGLVSEAVQNHVRARCIGLCNVPIEMQMDLAEILGVPASSVELDWVGLNHLGWVRKVLVDGRDVLPKLLEEIEVKLMEIYADPNSPTTLPELLAERGGAWYSRLAVQVMRALTGEEPAVHIVNVRNDGAVVGIAEDASVEVPCEISRSGVRPIGRGVVDESMLGLMQQVKAYERLTIRAAIEGGRATAVLALLANPLVPSAEVASDVVDDCVERGLI